MTRLMLLITVLAVSALVALEWNAARLHAQARADQGARLQLHGELTLHDQSFSYAHIDAVCDTGNGTMLYVVKQRNNSGAVRMVLHGCQQAQAER